MRVSLINVQQSLKMLSCLVFFMAIAINMHNTWNTWKLQIQRLRKTTRMDNRLRVILAYLMEDCNLGEISPYSLKPSGFFF